MSASRTNGDRLCSCHLRVVGVSLGSSPDGRNLWRFGLLGVSCNVTDGTFEATLRRVEAAENVGVESKVLDLSHTSLRRRTVILHSGQSDTVVAFRHVRQ